MASHVHSSGSSPSAPEPTSIPERWTPRLVFSLASIVLLLEMLAVSYMMISTALPTISVHYQTTQGAWLLTSFLLLGAVASPLLGKLADMYGKRKVLLFAVAGAAVGSFISAIAPSYAILILGRSLTGLLVPCLFLSYSLIRDVFPPKTVALAVSIATSGMGLIAIPAPFLTGWLIDNHGFRSIFWFFVIGLVLLGGMIFASTAESTVRLRSSIDLIGAVLLGSGIAGILIGVSFGPTWGWKNGSTLAYLIGGVALLIAWVASARVIREPLIELRNFGRRSVILTAVGAGFCYGSQAVFTILLPMMVMAPAVLGLGYGFGVTAEGFAIFQAPLGAMVMVGGLIVGVLVGKNIRPRLLMIIGMLGMAVGFSLIAVIHENKPVLIIIVGIFGVGMGMGGASIPNLLIEAVPPQLQATTASMVAVFQSIFPAVLPVIAFTVLNSHIAMATEGAVFYTDEGIRIAFLIGAAAAVLGAIAAVFLPRNIVQIGAEDGAAQETSLLPAH